jgi:organic hydroperoxide reductase OsmC/OhrA
MHAFPHHYKVAANATIDGNVDLISDKLAIIPSAPPEEFGGPGDCWSPETLLVASVADCFVLTFRAIARASKLSWLSINCHVDGVLEQVDSTTKFTLFIVSVTLEVSPDTDADKAQRLLMKSEANCLITNSLSAETQLRVTISTANK